MIAADAFGSGSTPSSASCSDSAGNTYSTDVSEGTPAALTTICSAHAIASTLASGATITVTWSGGLGNQDVRVQAWFVTGIANSPLDQTAAAGGTNDSPSSGTAAVTAQANELLFGAIFDESDTVASSGFSPGTNGTSNVCATSGTAAYTSLGGISTVNDYALFSIYCVVSSTGSYAATATLTSASPVWEAALATYKGVTP